MTQRRVFVAGHNGMVGSAICRQLSEDPDVDLVVCSRKQLNLVDQLDVRLFFQRERIDEVYIAAAKVGGIHANNSYPAEFIYENLMIQSNIIHSAHINNINKLLFLGSSCIYPKLSSQPMREESLLTGVLEPTNEPYAIAKIAGIKLCESYNRQYGRDYRSVMPTNLYGECDNFHPENAHVIPSLILRFHQAKINNEPQVVVWGSGEPMREFLYVDDMAEACLHVMKMSTGIYADCTSSMLSHINIGTGVDVTIRSLAEAVQYVVGFDGDLIFDSSKLDGAPRKLMDVSRLKKIGWESSIKLTEGLSKTYAWFLEHQDCLRQS